MFTLGKFRDINIQKISLETSSFIFYKLSDSFMKNKKVFAWWFICHLPYLYCISIIEYELFLDHYVSKLFSPSFQQQRSHLHLTVPWRHGRSMPAQCASFTSCCKCKHIDKFYFFQVHALQRMGSRFENLSGHERSCILSGQHRTGHCTCRLNNQDPNSARGSISRIVLLAEALSEVTSCFNF